MNQGSPQNQQLSAGKNRKLRNILIITLIVTICIAGAGVGYLLFARSHQESSKNIATQTSARKVSGTTPQPATTDIQKPAEPSPADLTTKVKDAYAAHYTLVDMEKQNRPSAKEISIRMDTQAPAYKPTGSAFYVSYNKSGSSITLLPYDPNPKDYSAPKQATVEIRKKISEVYENYGLKHQGTIGSTVNSSEVSIYTGHGLICSVEIEALQYSTSTASCGREADYKDAVAALKPIAAVIPDVTRDTALGNLKVHSSKVSGYQWAEVGQGSINGGGGSVALTYSKNGEWKYFRNSQQIIPCADYSTPDLRNAFKGESCYDEKNDHATVQ